MAQTDRFQIHYFLANESHAMDAFVRNKCEAELLVIIQEIGVLLGVTVKIESLAFEEGGLIEVLQFISEWPLLDTVFGTVLGVVLTKLSDRKNTTDREKDLREKHIQELTIREKALTIEKQLIEIQKIKKEAPAGRLSEEAMEQVAEMANLNIKIQSRRSNFYKHLSVYDKVTAVSFATLDASSKTVMSERLVPRSDFHNYVLLSNESSSETLDGVLIEIVAPLLQEGDYKWKGIYDGKRISFSMNDPEFRDAVLQEKVGFKHGDCINCVLHIRKKINEIGDVVFEYAVKTVLDKIDGGTTQETQQGKVYRDQKKQAASQGNLFPP